MIRSQASLQQESSDLFHHIEGTSESVFAEANALPFPKQGFKLSFIRDEFIPLCGGEDALIGLTTTEVCNNCVMPSTSDLKVSYCELLDHNQNCTVGIATPMPGNTSFLMLLKP